MQIIIVQEGIDNIDEIAKALNVEIRDIVSFGNDIPDLL